MLGNSQLGRQRIAALLMAFVLCFLAIALFSPLHQHRADGGCSLNGFEYVVQASHDPGIPVLELTELCWYQETTPAQLITSSAPAALFLRGPPAAA